MKILIVKPSSLGDVVQALPVLRLLKRHWPSSEIHWWVDSGLAPLLEGDPDLARVHRFERRRWASPVHWPEMISSIRGLRAENFDLVIDLQGLLRSGLVSWFSRGGFTIGVEDRREGACAFYDVAVPRPSYGTHAVEWYLAVLVRLGVPIHSDFSWMPERAQVAGDLALKHDFSRHSWIALLPGARWNNKRWPAAHFSTLVREAAAQFPSVRFVVLGGAADSPLAREIQAAEPERVVDMTGHTSLPEMVEWLRKMRLVITNDTGPMHVAVALGRPVVALFGPTDPRRTGPWKQIESVIQNKISCVPCMKDFCSNAKPLQCLDEVRPEVVLERARKAVAGSRSP